MNNPRKQNSELTIEGYYNRNKKNPRYCTFEEQNRQSVLQINFQGDIAENERFQQQGEAKPGGTRNGTKRATILGMRNQQLIAQEQRRTSRQKASIISANSQQRKSSLFVEFSDILNPQKQSQSSSSSSSSSGSSPQRQQVRKRVQKVTAEKQAPSGLSMKSSLSRSISIQSGKQLRPGQTLKDSMFGSRKSIMRQSSKKIIQEQSSSVSDNKSSLCNKSDVQNLNKTQIMELLEGSTQLAEKDKAKYLELLEKLERSVQDHPFEQRTSMQMKIRHTFVQLINHFHQNEPSPFDGKLLELQDAGDLGLINLDNSQNFQDEMSIFSDYSVFKRGSREEPRKQNLLFSPLPMIVRHPNKTPEQSKVDSIISRYSSNALHIEILGSHDKIQQLMHFYVQEMLNDGLEESYVDSDDDNDSSQSSDPTHIILKREIKSYLQKAKREPFKDYYPLLYINEHDFESLKSDFWLYSDGYPLLYLRKSIVFVFGVWKVFAKKQIQCQFISIIYHKIFVAMVLSTIIFNMYLFWIEFLEDASQEDINTIHSYKQVVLALYCIESLLKVSGAGIVKFADNYWNLYDLMLLILYALFLLSPNVMPIDFSFFRLIRLLLFMGVFIKSLQIMLISLSSAFKFLLEALMIMIIFSLFFALMGMHLFADLFKNTCMIKEYGILGTQRFCGYIQCPESEHCGPYTVNDDVPSNYDNFGYAWGQIMRVAIMNDWHTPMYQTMQTFHPVTFIIFILIIFIIGVFCANLMIAVLKIYFSQTLDKYEYEDIESENDKHNKTVWLNLRVLKHYGVYQSIQQTKQTFQYIRSSKVSPNSSQQIKLEKSSTNTHLGNPDFKQFRLSGDQTPVGEQIDPRGYNTSVVRKSMMPVYKKVKPYLSARQNREYQEEQDILKGIEPVQDKHWLEAIIESFSLRKLLLPRVTLTLQLHKAINENQQFNDDELCLPTMYKLKNNDIWAWKIKLKPSTALDYNSSSENDVFSLVEKAHRKKQKRAREFEFIKKSNPTHFYVIESREMLQRRRTSKRTQTLVQMTKTCLPIQKSRRYVDLVRNKTEPIPRTQSLKEQIDFIQDIEPLQQQQSLRPVGMIDQMGKSSITYETQQSGMQRLILNGMEYDYEELRKMIERPIGNDNDEEEINEMEDLYVEFRKFEAQQFVAFKHNWSGDDIVGSFPFFKRLRIFKALNTADKQVWMTGFKGKLLGLKKYVIMTLRMKEVATFFDMCILGNIIVLCLDGFVSNDVLLTVNIITTILLGFELLMKIISQNIRRFLQKVVNIFETFIVMGCMTQIIVEEVLYVQVTDTLLVLFLQLARGFKAILFYRIIKYNAFAVQMALITEKTFTSFFNLIVLMFFIILMFACFGAELYFGKFPMNDELAQAHPFDDIYKAWFSVYNIGTNDDWYGVVLLGTTLTTPWKTLLYATLVLMIINVLTFGLVLAIILDGFSKYLITDDEEQSIEDFKKSPYQINTEISENDKALFNEQMTLNTQESTRLDAKNDQFNEEPCDDLIISSPITQMIHNGKQSLGAKQQQHGKFLDLRKSINKIIEDQFKEFVYYEDVDCEDSLYIFNKENPVRKMLYWLISNYWYQITIDFVLLFSLVNMAVNTYYDHGEDLETSQRLEVVEMVMNILVLLDSIVKIIGLGFVFDKGSFLSEIWRTIDFIYVMVFLISAMIHSQLPLQAIILYFKFIRPMRLLNMFPSLKEVKDALAESFPDLVNVFVVQFLCWLIFAIFGMILYQGRFGFCEEVMNFGVGRKQCEAEGKEWIVYVHNFEDILQSISTLFLICTMDGWGGLLQLSYNSATDETGPLPFVNLWATYLFYFLFILVGSFFFLGFFTGVLYIYFQINRAKMINPDLTPDQVLFQKVCDQILIEEPYYSDPPENIIRVFAANLIQNEFYQKLISPLLLLNTRILIAIILVVLALLYKGSDHEVYTQLNKVHHVFASYLIGDTFLKLLAYGFIRYFGYGWRRFEFILSLCSLVDLIADQTIAWTDLYYYKNVTYSHFIWLRLAFFIRDFRVLLIIQQFKGLQRLMRVMGESMPYLMKILAFFVTIILVYAYAGCQMFGTINKGDIMDDYLNFNSLPFAMLTLFKCTTMDGWRAILLDCSNLNPYCKDDPNQCGPDLLISQAYHYSYVLISSLIVFQLFILALVEQFEGFYNSQNNVVQTYIEQIDWFRTIWCKYSFETKGKMMHTKQLAHFLLQLGEPLGNSKDDNIWDSAKNASNFHIWAYFQFIIVTRDLNGYVHFKEVLYETIRFAYKDLFKNGTKEGIYQMKQFDKDIRFRLHHRRLSVQNRRPRIQQNILIKGNFNILQEYIYVLLVFRAWRSYKNKLILKAGDKKGQGDKFSESVRVSFHDPQIEDLSIEEELQFPTTGCLARQISQESEPETKEPYLPHYTIQKNLIKKQKVKLQFIDYVDPLVNDNIIFEPLDTNSKRIIAISNQDNHNVSIQKKSNLKPRVIPSLPKSQEAKAPSLSQQSQTSLQKHEIPNPMILSDSELGTPNRIQTRQQLAIFEDEAEIQSLRNTDHQFLRKPIFGPQNSDSSNVSDYLQVRTEMHQGVREMSFNVEKLKKNLSFW